MNWKTYNIKVANGVTDGITFTQPGSCYAMQGPMVVQKSLIRIVNGGIIVKALNPTSQTQGAMKT